MNGLEAVQEIAKTVDGKVDDVCVLPDGSGFATMSFALPKDHWLTKDGCDEPPMPFRMGDNLFRRAIEAKVMEAARYAIRASTMNGKIEDFDPDAMARNFIIGLFGYYTADGLSHLGELLTEPSNA